MEQDFVHLHSARHLAGYRLLVEFSDGFTGEVDLAEELHGPVFEPLRDLDYFRQFSLVGTTIEWPNGADFAPEFLHKLAHSGQAALA